MTVKPPTRTPDPRVITDPVLPHDPAPAFTPQPFRENWLHTIGWAGFGGIMGAGAISYLCANPSGGAASDPWMLRMLVGAAVVGAVVGGWASHAYQQHSHEVAEQARQDAEVGAAITDVAPAMIAPFDHSGDGKIQVDNATGSAALDERVQAETRERSGSRLEYDWGDGEFHTRNYTYHETRDISAATIWQAADANGDRVVDAAELGALLVQSDANGDGHLTTEERAAFEQAHPTVTSDWTPVG